MVPGDAHIGLMLLLAVWGHSSAIPSPVAVSRPSNVVFQWQMKPCGGRPSR